MVCKLKGWVSKCETSWMRRVAYCKGCVDLIGGAARLSQLEGWNNSLKDKESNAIPKFVLVCRILLEEQRNGCKNFKDKVWKRAKIAKQATQQVTVLVEYLASKVKCANQIVRKLYLELMRYLFFSCSSAFHSIFLYCIDGVLLNVYFILWAECIKAKVSMNVRSFMWWFLTLVMCTGNPNLVMALAGNKADLAPKRKIEAEVRKILAVFYLHLFYMHVL